MLNSCPVPPMETRGPQPPARFSRCTSAVMAASRLMGLFLSRPGGRVLVLFGQSALDRESPEARTGCRCAQATACDLLHGGADCWRDAGLRGGYFRDARSGEVAEWPRGGFVGVARTDLLRGVPGEYCVGVRARRSAWIGRAVGADNRRDFAGAAGFSCRVAFPLSGAVV